MEKLIQLCQMHQLSYNQLMLLQLILMKVRAGNLLPNQNVEAVHLIKKGYLDTEYHLTTKGRSLLKEANRLFKTSAKDRKLIEDPEFLENVRKFRELFPNCKAGGNKPARSNIETLKQKFIEFFDQYPDYQEKWDLILLATARYVESWEDRGYDYMTTSKYFILKNKNKESELLDEIDRLQDEANEPEQVEYAQYKAM